MSEHPLAGQTVTLVIDGGEEEYRLEEGISQEDGEAFINSMLGTDASESQPEVDHPEFELADSSHAESTEAEGLRIVCRIDQCEHTDVFETMNKIKDGEWTELSLGKGLLTDRTDLHYGYCPHHSFGGDNGYEPQGDMASHEFNGGVPWRSTRGLQKFCI